MLSFIGVIWGLTGVAGILIFAIIRLSSHVIDLFYMSLTMLHIASLICWVVFMVYTEGFKGFQQRFSPRVASRCWFLFNHPHILCVALAPLYVVGFIHATLRRKVISYLVTLLIFIAVNMAAELPQPWRGILDAGVVAGLCWGLISLIVMSIHAFWQKKILVDPEIPQLEH